MRFLALVAILTVTLHQSQGARIQRSQGQSPTSEERLFDRLFSNYQKAVLPPLGSGENVSVQIGLTLRCGTFEEDTGVVVTSAWQTMNWQDKRLAWSSTDAGGIDGPFSVPSEHLWSPDIRLYNAADETKLSETRAVISNDGTVTLVSPAQYFTRCDGLKCYLKFGSWTYDGFTVDVEVSNAEQPVDTTFYDANCPLAMDTVTARKDVVYYECCAEPYPSITFHISYSSASPMKFAHKTVLTGLLLILFNACS